jgi:hypothetical protein
MRFSVTNPTARSDVYPLQGVYLISLLRLSRANTQPSLVPRAPMTLLPTLACSLGKVNNAGFRDQDHRPRNQQQNDTLCREKKEQ